MSLSGAIYAAGAIKNSRDLKGGNWAVASDCATNRLAIPGNLSDVRIVALRVSNRDKSGSVYVNVSNVILLF